MDIENLNPDWKRAQAHGKALKPGFVSNFDINNQKPTLLCPCCLNIIQKQPIPLCQHSKQLQFLGFGFPLFYDFLGNCLILLLVCICSYSGMSLYWAIKSNESFCHKNSFGQVKLDPGSIISQECTSYMVQFSRIDSTLTQEEVVIRSIAFIIHILTLLYLRNRQRVLRKYFHERSTLISDYSIVIKNIPRTTELAHTLTKFFQQQFSIPYTIHQITYAPDIEELEELYNQKKFKINQKLKLMKSNKRDQNYQENLHNLTLQIKEYKKKIQKICQDIDQQIKNDTIICQKVIVSFKNQNERKSILEEFYQINSNKLKEYFGQNYYHLTMVKAPQPRQINWENFNVKKSEKVFRNAIGWIISILFLTIVTITFYFILQAKSKLLSDYFHYYSLDKQLHQNLRTKAVVIVYIGLISIIIFNKFVMSIVLHKICHYEKHQTVAGQQISFALKYGFGMFFTTALMTLAVQAIRFSNYFSHEYGVIEQESIMFYFNSFFVPILWLINPFQLFQLAKRAIKYGSPNMTQKQANLLMQDSHYDIGKRYAQILQSMWFTFLYATIIPFGAILTFVGLIFYYLVDKYNLLRRSSIHGNISGQLSKTAMKLLDLTLLLRAAGQILFDYQIRSSGHYLSIIFLIVGFIYLLVPWDWFLSRITLEKFKSTDIDFEDVRYKFTETYHTFHPIYQKLYLRDHLRKRNLTMGIGLAVPSAKEIACSDVRLYRDQN